MRPRLLDLFCGAGGASMGYHVGTAWRPAGLWDRIRYFGKGREVGPETLWPEDQERANA